MERKVKCSRLPRSAGITTPAAKVGALLVVRSSFSSWGVGRVFQIPESMVVLSSRNFSNHRPAEASANHPAGHDSRRDLVGGEGHTFFPWLSALMGEHAQTSSPVCGRQRAGSTAGKVSPRGSSQAWFPGSVQRGWALGGALVAGTGPCFPDPSSYFL